MVKLRRRLSSTVYRRLHPRGALSGPHEGVKLTRCARPAIPYMSPLPHAHHVAGTSRRRHCSRTRGEQRRSAPVASPAHPVIPRRRGPLPPRPPRTQASRESMPTLDATPGAGSRPHDADSVCPRPSTLLRGCRFDHSAARIKAHPARDLVRSRSEWSASVGRLRASRLGRALACRERGAHPEASTAPNSCHPRRLGWRDDLANPAS